MSERKSREPSPARRRRPPAAVVGVASLLFLQALGLIGLGLLPAAAPALGLDLGAWFPLVNDAGLTVQVLIAVEGVLAFVSALGLLRLHHAAWVTAMAVQGIDLLVALVLYFSSKPNFVYPIMVFSVFVVLYLNYSAVADPFRHGETERQKGPTR